MIKLLNHVLPAFFSLFILVFSSIAFADTNVTADITTNTTWTTTGSPYIVTKTISILNGAKLTIQPGVVVKFNNGFSLNVGGSSAGYLDARGTSAQPIRFTSSAAAPVPGSWGAVNFQYQADSSQSFLDYVIVEYAGSGGNSALSLSVNIPITNSTIQNNNNFGISVIRETPTITNNRFDTNSTGAVTIALSSSFAVSPILRNNTYVANGSNNLIKVTGSYIYNSAVWTKDNAPYWVTAQVYVRNNATLTIEAGVTVKFNPGIYLRIADSVPSGYLIAKGTVDQPIRFTSIAANPAPGDWGGIIFSNLTDSSLSAFEQTIVEYATTALAINKGAMNVVNNRFESNSQAVEIGLSSAFVVSPVLKNNTYINNGNGNTIKISGSYIYNSTVWTKDNAPYWVTSQVYVRNNATLTIEAGVTVKFNPGIYLRIADSVPSGYLIAKGTADQPIRFTSIAANPTPGSWGGIIFSNLTDSTQSLFEQTIVEYATTGLAIYKGAMNVVNNRFESNSQALEIGLSSSFVVSPVLKNNTYINNGNGNTIKISGSYIYNSTVWTKDNAPYWVTSQVYVRNDAVLTIEPGVTVKFDPGIYLRIADSVPSGYLVAKGTVNQPITFTSSSANPAPGSWGGILIYNQNDPILSAIEYANINYATTGLAVYKGAMNITNNHFESNSQAVEIGLSSFHVVSPVLRNNTYVNNGAGNTIKITGSYIYNPTVWTKDNAPYLLTTHIYVRNNALLTIEPGVVVKANAGIYFNIGDGQQGGLYAKGTPNQPIAFTSSSANPAPGDWGGMVFGSQIDPTSSALDNVIVEYAGSNASHAIVLNTSVPITNSIIRNNKNDGISLASSAFPQILKNQFINNNGFGVSFRSSTVSSAITSNSFINNALGGAFAINGSSMAAQANWWANASGPSGGGSGSGQSITGNINYEPWLGEPFNSNLFFNNVNISPKRFNPNQGKSVFHAVVNKNVNWTITIQNSSGTTVKTLSGSGSTIHQVWLGDDANNEVLGNGNYNYKIQATDPSTSDSISLLGSEILDNTLPIAKITSPTAYTVIGAQVQISGTASGSAFSSYILEYGLGENPSSWTQFASGTTAVNDGLLASWNVPPVMNQAMTIRLTVKNAQNVTATDSVIVSAFSIYGLADNPDQFSPDGDANIETTTISASLTLAGNYTVQIKDQNLQVKRTVTGSGTFAQFVWDGKDQSGNLVADGVYSYQVTAQHQESGMSAISPVGAVTVDTVVPIAKILSPIDNQTLTNLLIPITGTASDLNLSNYTLDYGVGPSPTSWTQFLSSSTPVTDGALGNWNVSNIANNIYTLRLTVKDKAGHATVVLRTITLDSLRLTNVTFSPRFINTTIGEMSTISYSLDRDANVVLKVYRAFLDSNGAYQRELKDTLGPITSHLGQQSITWTGADSLGVLLAPSAYVFVLEANTIDGQRSALYDPVYSLGSVTIQNGSVTPANFDPYQGETATINYSLLKPSWVQLKIGIVTAPAEARTLLNYDPRNSTNNSELWDGRGNDGNVVPGGSYIVRGWANVLPDNSIVITAPTSFISSVTSSPYAFYPLYGQQTKINFSISTDANVTVEIISPAGVLIRTLQTNVFSKSGTHSTFWDGKDNAGKTVFGPGSYRIRTTAVTLKGLSFIREGNITVF